MHPPDLVGGRLVARFATSDTASPPCWHAERDGRSAAVIDRLRISSGRVAGVRVRGRLLLLFLPSELVEARLNRGEVFYCWGHDKPYLALAVRYAVMFRPRTAKSSGRARSNLSSIKISSYLSAGTKAATAGSASFCSASRISFPDGVVPVSRR